MKAPWHPTKPIKKLFSQLKTTSEFATAGNQGYSKITIVRIGYQLISDTGLFKQELKEWRRKPEVEWTMAIFKTFFKEADIDRLATTEDGGYHSANQTVLVEPVSHIVAAAPTISEMTAMKEQVAQLQKKLAAKIFLQPTHRALIQPPPRTAGHMAQAKTSATPAKRASSRPMDIRTKPRKTTRWVATPKSGRRLLHANRSEGTL